MRAGPMTTRLSLLKPDHNVNDYGEQQTTFIPFRTVWAERVQWSGNRSEEVDEHFADENVRYRIRSAHPIKEHWRVKPLDADTTYTVVAIEENRRRGMLTLYCEKLNP